MRFHVMTMALALAACSSKSNVGAPPQDASDVGMTGPIDTSRDGDGSLAGDDAASTMDGARAPTNDAADANARVGADASSGVQDGAPIETLVYVGGYGSPYPFGVYALDRATFALTKRGENTDLGPSPSYIAASAGGRVLYIANEDDAQSGVTVAKVDASSGLVSKLEREPYEGSGLVFTSLDLAGRFLLAADYNGSTAQVYAIEADGRLSPAVDTQRFPEGAHSHSIRVHPSSKWAYVPNKDAKPPSIAQFSFDASSGKLTPLSPATVAAPGGPRHLAFHPTGNFAYAIMEYTGVVRAYSVGAQGQLTELEAKPSLPAGFSGKNTGAHVLVHPNGKYLYASNRGHDQLAVFTVGDDGKLTLIQHAPTGKTPRNFDIDSRGELLVAAGQDDGTLTAYAIGADGRLTQRGNPITGLTKPIAVLVLNRAKASAAVAP